MRLFEQAGDQGEPGKGAADPNKGTPPPGTPPPQDDPNKGTPPPQDDPNKGTPPKDAAKDEGAPEKYDFKPVEGHELDAELVGEFSTVAKELGLSQAKADKIMEIGHKVAQKQVDAYNAFVEKTRGEWVAAVKADKEIGGPNLEQNLGLAKKAIAAVDEGGELVKYLNESGAGDNPALIRAFMRFGKMISEDKLVTGENRSAASQGAPTLSYPNSKMS